MSCRTLALIIGMTSGAVWAGDYCSLVVTVIDPGGSPRSQVPVAVTQGEARLSGTTDSVGTVQFCSLGVRRASVMAGARGGCGYTTVENVPLAWGEMKKVTIILDDLACRNDGPPPIAACAIMVRFVDGKGTWIPDVTFNPPLSQVDPQTSDRYGRIMIFMKRKETIESKAERTGFASSVVSLTCERTMDELERRVVLARLP